jgi:hypothetical protein
MADLKLYGTSLITTVRFGPTRKEYSTYCGIFNKSFKFAYVSFKFNKLHTAPSVRMPSVRGHIVLTLGDGDRVWIRNSWPLCDIHPYVDSFFIEHSVTNSVCEARHHW